MLHLAMRCWAVGCRGARTRLPVSTSHLPPSIIRCCALAAVTALAASLDPDPAPKTTSSLCSLFCAPSAQPVHKTAAAPSPRLHSSLRRLRHFPGRHSFTPGPTTPRCCDPATASTITQPGHGPLTDPLRHDTYASSSAASSYPPRLCADRPAYHHGSSTWLSPR
jgi:hypothetical protein